MHFLIFSKYLMQFKNEKWCVEAQSDIFSKAEIFSKKNKQVFKFVPHYLAV